MYELLSEYISSRKCWKSCEIDEEERDSKGCLKGLMWHKDLGKHVYGAFSIAVMQANEVVEDQCQLESGPLSSLNNDGPLGTFIGVYDGHGGPQAPCFVNNNLFYNIKRFATDHQEISFEVIKKAFLATDKEFLEVVRKQWGQKPHIASQGSCCLAGIICNGYLYIANAGDSRAVLGRLDKSRGIMRAMQLSTDHNASVESERDEIRSLHPHDPNVVFQKHKVWRVKGIIQGITKRLIKAALENAAKKREMRYEDLKKIDVGVRRHFHDDITVVVVFLDQLTVNRNHFLDFPFSIKGGDC